MRGRGIELAVIDVDSDPDLVSRYGERVPVLVGDGVEICEGRLDRGAFARFLQIHLSPRGPSPERRG